MKRSILLFACLLYGCILSAQDVITKKDGTTIQALVTDIGESQISYKYYSNPEGPTYTMNFSDILVITYENGMQERFNSNNEASYSSPQGVMTYNSWSGKVTMGGTTLSNEMLAKYFSPEEYNEFQSGKATSTVGGVIGCIGAFVFGWNIGTLVAGGEPNTAMLIGGGAVTAGGLIISAIGEKKMKKAVNSYNTSVVYRPDLRLGATPNGIGLALVF
ncbi:MAG: hypothetical protein J6W61_02060 [Bacteroidales bacterium]|nr:hypothetical protein [Bacteroidales bacterium]